VDKGVGNLAENARIGGVERWITPLPQGSAVEKCVNKPVLIPV